MGEEYSELALNEYFSLKAVKKAGVNIPNIKLSKNNKFLLVERFNYDKTTNKVDSMKALYKTIVMNYLLKNGDAHLKNFGILYDEELKNIYFAPAYDIVSTIVYFYKDRPALSMFGKKTWFVKKELVKFGVEFCYLTPSEANALYEVCLEALKESIKDLEVYLLINKDFEDIGSKMIDIWKLALDEKIYKEIPIEITRNWTKN